MSIRAILITIAIALAPTFSSAASNQEKLLEAMEICITNYPDMSAVRRGARAAQFRSEGRYNGAEIYTANSQRVIFIATTGNGPAECSFGVNNLYGRDAIALATSWLQQKYGSNAVPEDLPRNSPADVAWIVTTPNGSFGVAVLRQFMIPGFFNGSAILVTNDLEEQ